MNLTLPFQRILIQCNFSAFVTIILLMIFIITNVSFSKQINIKFFLLCAATALLTISDNVRFYTYNLPHPTALRYISAATGYTLRPLIVYFIYNIVIKTRSRRIHLLTIPVLINGLIAYISCIPACYGLMFYYDDSNTFIRGFLGFLPYVVSIIYICLLIYKILNRNIQNKSESLIVIFIVLFGSIATFLESYFKYDLILSQVMIVATVFYYLFLNVQVFKRDTLTHLENRRCFYLQINKLKKSEFIILSMDLNNLKKINDTYGHKAGDEAILTTVEYMNNHFQSAGTIYRTGGDEFMCIFKKKTKFEVTQMIKNFQESLKITRFQVACGISIYHPGDDIDKVISLSDYEMYQNKQKLKKL